MSDDGATKVLIALHELEVRLVDRLRAVEVKVEERTEKGQGIIRRYAPPSLSGGVLGALVSFFLR